MKVKKVHEGTYVYRVSDKVELFVEAKSKREAKQVVKTILNRPSDHNTPHSVSGTINLKQLNPKRYCYYCKSEIQTDIFHQTVTEIMYDGTVQIQYFCQDCVIHGYEQAIINQRL